jgi:hypothetical protein
MFPDVTHRHRTHQAIIWIKTAINKDNRIAATVLRYVLEEQQHVEVKSAGRLLDGEISKMSTPTTART